MYDARRHTASGTREPSGESDAMSRRTAPTTTVSNEQAGTNPAPTMRAVVQDTYGDAGALRLDRVPRPTIKDDEVLVQVRAAGLDRGTWHLMTGKPYLMRLGLGFRGPKNPVPGRDVAGIVAAVGSAVTRFAIGDEVYGVGPGSFAEYAVAREDKLALKPATLSFEQAAVVPISAGTALQALTDHGRVEAGQSVLVVGASGGVGSYAVQLATALGAEVTGVASTAKLDLVRSLGADRVLDYTSDDWADGTRRYDLVLDIASNPGLFRLRRALAPKGTAVLVGGEDGGVLTGGMNRSLRALMLSPLVSQRFAWFIARERATDLDRLGPFLRAGTVVPSIDRVYPLDQAPAAMRLMEAGLVRGKVAITVSTGAGS